MGLGRGQELRMGPNMGLDMQLGLGMVLRMGLGEIFPNISDLTSKTNKKHGFLQKNKNFIKLSSKIAVLCCNFKVLTSKIMILRLRKPIYILYVIKAPKNLLL